MGECGQDGAPSVQLRTTMKQYNKNSHNLKDAKNIYLCLFKNWFGRLIIIIVIDGLVKFSKCALLDCQPSVNQLRALKSHSKSTRISYGPQSMAQSVGGCKTVGCS